MPHQYLLAREGWPFIAISLVAAAAVTVVVHPLWSIPLWLIAAFVIQFFRDPKRTPPGDRGLLIAPADGKVVAVEPCRDPYLDREGIKLSVFMNVFSVHSNRMPEAGRIEQIWYHPGSFVNAALDKASAENERNAVHLRCDNGMDVVCVQVAGLIARRILCYVRGGERVVRGQRYGFIRFGSRVDLYLPSEVNVKVAIGDWVTAGETVVAGYAE